MTRTSVPLLAVALLATALAATPRPAAAAWPHEPNNGNVALCTAGGYQQSPRIVSDGAGGAIVTWIDSRSGTNDIYAQRISVSGTSQWTADGVSLCAAAREQWSPTGATTLRFGLPRAARVELALYDQQGRRVRALLGGTQPAGERTIAWDGSDDGGRALPAGLYFVRLATGGHTYVSRLAVIR